MSETETFDWESAASTFDLPAGRFGVVPYTASIERCRRPDGPPRWAVRDEGLCLLKTGEWVFEPQPSSRDDAFLALARFDTKEEALTAFQKFGVYAYRETAE